MMKDTCAALAMVTFLLCDGRCQDKFLHRTDPCREQERINITFRWIKQHNSSCPLFKTGVAFCLPTCAQGLSAPVMWDSGVGFGIFWAFWLHLGVLYIWGLLVSSGLPFMYKTCVLLCASNWAPPYLSNLLGECLAFFGFFCFCSVSCVLGER